MVAWFYAAELCRAVWILPGGDRVRVRASRGIWLHASSAELGGWGPSLYAEILPALASLRLFSLMRTYNRV